MTQVETTRAKRQKELNEQHERLTEMARGKVCIKCQCSVQVAYIKQDFVLRCDCYPDPPMMEKPNREGERLGAMVNQAMVLAPSEQEIARLSVETVRQYLAPKASEEEAYLFLRLCLSLQLNPFIGEAYLIKYSESKPAAYVVGLRAHLKWASRDPSFAGYEAGVVIETKLGSLEYREGTLVLSDETLVGGWCRVHKKGWAVAPRHTVSMTEYARPSQSGKENLWDTHPATMIEKCAIAQELRRTCPENVGYIYQVAKQQGVSLSLEEPLNGQVIEGRTLSAPKVDKDTGEISKAVDDLYGPKAEPVTGSKMPSEALGRPQMASEAPQGVAEDKTGSFNVPEPKTFVDLLNNCVKVYKLNKAATLQLLGIDSPLLITDMPEAWYRVQQKMAAKETEAN